MNKNYLLRVMRITLFLLVAGMLSVSAKGYSQKVTFSGRNVTFTNVLDVIRKQTGYKVFTTKSLINEALPQNLDVNNMPLNQFLKLITTDQPLGFQVEERTISFFKKPVSRTETSPLRTEDVIVQQTIQGRVTDLETGEGLAGVTVLIKGTTNMVGTDNKGLYQLVVDKLEKGDIVVFRYLGRPPKEVEYTGQKTINVQLEPSADAIKDVVVTGMFKRNKESYTGSASTYTAKELKSIGNQGILKSLAVLDPSFAIIDNNQFGSNPNRLPDLEIQGKTSIMGLRDEFQTNPNQPLFILNGFESSLAVIADLSMDRVESVTILRDAAATAIYGSKAANGVVVIETRKPKAGKLAIDYTFNGSVKFADLSSYNLMNAEEKLKFELLSELYGTLNEDGNLIVGHRLNSEALYNERLKEVRRGVNTYWMNEPLRTAITQNHTLFAEGGEENIRYGVSINHNINNGVMKGSSRGTTNGNIQLQYRKNSISFNNSLSIDNLSAHNEAVPFSDFSRANPYHRKYNPDGTIKTVLEDYRFSVSNLDPLYNPLYNAGNLNINKIGETGFTNNTDIIWQTTSSLELRARLGIIGRNGQNIVFRSPFNSEFFLRDELERGNYMEENYKGFRYDGSISARFSKMLSAKNLLTVYSEANMQHNNQLNTSYEVFGFTDDAFANPNFAMDYRDDKRALYTDRRNRTMSFVLNAGYSYDQRYNLEGTIRSDGSSVFGSERQFNTLWSLGTSWNVHRESFLKSWSWLDELRLRASIGRTGNQNFDDYISMRIYSYNNDNRNPFGSSTLVSNMGNAALQWQTTLKKNLGFNISAFERRFKLGLDYFMNSTDPLLVRIDVPTSLGVSSIVTNLGEQITNGLNMSMDYSIIQNSQFSWRINANMKHQNYEFRNMGNSLDRMNEQNRSRTLNRYYDGGSPTDLWAVRSLGIDPATGREIFLNKNNEQTFVHNYQDEVVVGNSDADIDGVIGTTLFYKGFTFAANIRYRLGGQEFMQTLYEKVENISQQEVAYNQDKRALYERWQKPGDIAKFKAISMTESTPISSRFVQDNNIIQGESFSFGYDTSTANWLKSIRLSSASFKLYMNDIFYLSTIKRERGIDYPFERSVSFSFTARF